MQQHAAGDLTPIGPVDAADAGGHDTKTRRLVFERQGGEWTINGKTWAEVEASGSSRSIADPALNAVEIWELENESGGWFHPVHIHLVDFQVSTATAAATGPAHERGPEGRDLPRRERDDPGDHAATARTTASYMIHCHNTVHEDNDMMFQIQVGVGGHDPITAAPPQPL